MDFVAAFLICAQKADSHPSAGQPPQIPTDAQAVGAIFEVAVVDLLAGKHFNIGESAGGEIARQLFGIKEKLERLACGGHAL